MPKYTMSPPIYAQLVDGSGHAYRMADRVEISGGGGAPDGRPIMDAETTTVQQLKQRLMHIAGPLLRDFSIVQLRMYRDRAAFDRGGKSLPSSMRVAELLADGRPMTDSAEHCLVVMVADHSDAEVVRHLTCKYACGDGGLVSTAGSGSGDRTQRRSILSTLFGWWWEWPHDCPPSTTENELPPASLNETEISSSIPANAQRDSDSPGSVDAVATDSDQRLRRRRNRCF